MEMPLTQPYAPEEAPLLAAREIVKHLDGAENFELPIWGFSGDGETRVELDYDGVVGLIASIIRHYFSLEPSDEATSTNSIATS